MRVDTGRAATGHANQQQATALAGECASILAQVRARAPRVHCITNSAAQVLTANMLLAIGAHPSLTIAPEEIADFVSRADALLVNLGTLDAGRRAAIGLALDVVDEARLPWVLDPVLCDRSPGRATLAGELARREPDVVRGNAAELATLIGRTADPPALDRFALDTLAIVAATGATDILTDGSRRVLIGNGHALMAQSTAIGCAGTALIAACLAVSDDALLATTAALLALGVAGEIAAQRARGPGSFVPELLDALHALDAPALTMRARIEGPTEVTT